MPVPGPASPPFSSPPRPLPPPRRRTPPVRVDIGGGRGIYVECRGEGAPAVVIVAGAKASAADWTEAVARRAERLRRRRRLHPGLRLRPAGNAVRRGAEPQRPGAAAGERRPTRPPTSTRSSRAAGIATPVVLVAHSYGGVIARLYARTWPDDVAGMVLVDALSEGLRAAETPEEWATQRVLLSGDMTETLKLYPEIEQLDRRPELRRAPRRPAAPADAARRAQRRPSVGAAGARLHRRRHPAARRPARLRLRHRPRREGVAGRARRQRPRRPARHGDRQRPRDPQGPAAARHRLDPRRRRRRARRPTSSRPDAPARGPRCDPCRRRHRPARPAPLPRVPGRACPRPAPPAPRPGSAAPAGIRPGGARRGARPCAGSGSTSRSSTISTWPATPSAPSSGYGACAPRPTSRPSARSPFRPPRRGRASVRSRW